MTNFFPLILLVLYCGNLCIGVSLKNLWEKMTSTSHTDILILIRLSLYKLPIIMFHKDNDLLVKYGNPVVSFNLYILENTTSQSMISIGTRADPTNYTPRPALCPVEAKIRCFTKNHTLPHPQ